MSLSFATFPGRVLTPIVCQAYRDALFGGSDRWSLPEAGFTLRGITIEDGYEADRDAAAGSEEASAQFTVDGMQCEYCSANISASLKKVAGVRFVSVDLEGKAASVVYDPAQTDSEAVMRAIQAAGDFQATLKQ